MSEYLEVCTDKFFCVSGVADGREREKQRLVREREEESDRGAPIVDGGGGGAVSVDRVAASVHRGAASVDGGAARVDGEGGQLE